MAIIPQIQTTGGLIEATVYPQYPRPYLGMSSLGAKCLRSLWYGFHWVTTSTINAKTKRIFDRGSDEERIIVSDLKRIGVKCTKFINGVEEELTGELHEKQEEFVGCAGHVKGHCDGRAIGLIEAPKSPHVLEFKTMQEKYFKEVVKNGVQISNPKYYCQAQRYMHATKKSPLFADRTLFVVTNKNDQSRYYERIRYDKEFAEELVKKEISVVTAELPPIKLFRENDFECRFCPSRIVCHNGGVPNKNCRTCSQSDIMDDGKWFCKYWEKDLSAADQLAGCMEWSVGWGL